MNSAITFSVSGMIRLTSALPALEYNGTLSITGPQSGLTISGDTYYIIGESDPSDVRIFRVNSLANVTLNNLTMRDGRSDQNVDDGGAIYNVGTLTVTGSTLTNNYATHQGGAIYNVGTMTVINCTLAFNEGFEGGAIFNGRRTTLINSTVAANYSYRDGSAIFNTGGLTAVTWKNNLFAQNNGGYGAFRALTDPTSSGDANKNYSFASLSDAGLSGLANNGGPTQTMALSPTSPVVDKGLDTTLAPDSLSTDQRGTGYARKGGSAIDIGAFEVQAQGSTTATAINSQPQNQSVCESASANFSVGATGTTLTYQWRKGGVNLTDGGTISGTISGATSANLIISSAATSSAGSYDVVVTGSGGTATSNAATLTINSAPAITAQPVDQIVNPGGNATFTATSDRAESIKWQVSTDGGTTFSDISGATAATLNLSAVTSAQSGNKYRAVFSGACGNPVNSGAATLTVRKLDQTITFANPGAKTFGDAAFNLGGTSTSGLTVSYTIVSGPATVSDSTLTITGAGSVTVRASQGGSDSYNAAPNVTQTFTVNKAVLLVTAENKTGVYSDALPLLSYAITGFVSGNTASVVSGTPALGTTANIVNGNIMSGAGTYPITAALGSLSTTNYSFGFAPGVLTVGKETTQTDYTGDNYVITAGPNVSTASAVRLAARLTQEADGATGDITLARARFELYKFNNTSTTPSFVFGNLPVNSSGDVETTVSLPVDDAYTVRVVIESANSYWTAQPIYEGTLTIAYGSTEKRVTGGGWVADSASANGKGNFGFTVNYGNNGSPKGNALYTFRSADGFNYRVKSNSWQGGGLTFYQDAAKAAFSGRGNVQKIDSATGVVVESWGNYTFTVDIIDGDLRNPRESDRYAIQILNDAGTVWRQIGSRTNPVQLGGGNVSVQSK